MNSTKKNWEIVDEIDLFSPDQSKIHRSFTFKSKSFDLSSKWILISKLLIEMN